MSPMVQGALGPMEVIDVDGAPSSTVNGHDGRTWLGLVARAFGKAGISHKAAASDMGIDPGLLSAQLGGVPGKHVSWSRLGQLPSSFWQELLPLIVEFHGLSLTDSPQQRNDAEIGRLIREAVVRSVQR